MQRILFFFLCAFQLYSMKAQTTVGLTQNDPGSTEGYVVFQSNLDYTTYLIDKCGRNVHSWTSDYKSGHSSYLLPDGSVMRSGNYSSPIFTAGGTGGIVEKIDWDGNVVWSYVISDSLKCSHHDIKVMPNGNVLVISWEYKSLAESINSGRDSMLVGAAIWSEQILEIEPVGTNGGNIVWEWHAWDHLVQDFDATKPNYGIVDTAFRKVNINFNASVNPDWLHINGIDYNPDLDQILLSIHGFSEIWIIDHSTTTLEAKTSSGGNSGKGGDLLYRWGNPQAYNNSGTQVLFGQHNPHWIESGLPNENKIMIFNNGINRPGGNYSTIDIIAPPVNGFNYDASLPFMPSSYAWQYNAGNTHNMFSGNISGAQQLENGNVFICNGKNGIFLEVNSLGTTLWNYVNPVGVLGIATQGTPLVQNPTFRANLFPATFSGFAGHTLTPGTILEDVNTVSEECITSLSVKELSRENNFVLYPNPTNGKFTLTFDEPSTEVLIMNFTNTLGQIVSTKTVQKGSIEFSCELEKLSSGIYLLHLNGDMTNQTRTVEIQ